MPPKNKKGREPIRVHALEDKNSKPLNWRRRLWYLNVRVGNVNVDRRLMNCNSRNVDMYRRDIYVYLRDVHMKLRNVHLHSRNIYLYRRNIYVNVRYVYVHRRNMNDYALARRLGISKRNRSHAKVGKLCFHLFALSVHPCKGSSLPR
jgi:hypothetical protein